jgi:hypothetical protein
MVGQLVFPPAVVTPAVTLLKGLVAPLRGETPIPTVMLVAVATEVQHRTVVLEVFQKMPTTTRNY